MYHRFAYILSYLLAADVIVGNLAQKRQRAVEKIGRRREVRHLSYVTKRKKSSF